MSISNIKNTKNNKISNNSIKNTQIHDTKPKKDIYTIEFDIIYDIIKTEDLSHIEQFVTVNEITRNKIRSLIGKWFRPSDNQMSIKNVIDDIYYRIFNRIQGRIDYYTGKPLLNQNNGKYVYILIIKSTTVLFVDKNRGICYIIL